MTSRNFPRGFSLVSTMIGGVVAAILALAFAQMMTHQARSTKALSEKLSALDHENLLRTVMLDGAVCNFVLTDPSYSAHRNPNPVVFNSGDPNAEIRLARLPISANAASPELKSVLPVKSIIISDFISAGTPGRWLATIRVNFDSAQLIQPIKPAAVSLLLTTDPATGPAANAVTGCASPSPALPPGGCYLVGAIYGSDALCNGNADINPATAPIPTKFGSNVCPAGWTRSYFLARDKGGSNGCQWYCCQ